MTSEPAPRPAVLYERVNEVYFVAFPTEPPEWVRESLTAAEWIYYGKKSAWYGPVRTWADRIAPLLREYGDLKEAKGQVNKPGRREMNAARSALAAAAGGQPVTEEAVFEAARIIMAKRNSAETRDGYLAATAGTFAADAAEEVLGKVEIKGKPVVTKIPGLAQLDLAAFPAWAEANLVIRDKGTGALIPFKLNHPQRLAFEFLLKQWKEEGWIRQVWDKSRQVGLSTLIQGIFIFVIVHVPTVDGAVLADTTDSSDAVFRRSKTYIQNLKKLPADLERNNKKEIQFGPPWGSALRVLVADNKSVGLSDTRFLLHGSEVAFYGDNGAEIMSSILPSVPDVPGTMVVLESTANGQAGVFYDRWVAATEGRGRYRPFFVGILDDPTCRLMDTPAEDDPVAWKAVPPEWLEDEPRLKAMGAPWPLLAWRRHTIEEKCQGQPGMFFARYPASAEESFRSTGGSVFPLSVVDPALKRTTNTELYNPTSRFRLNETRDAFIPDRFGPLKIKKKAEAGHPYMAVIDTATGESASGEVGDTEKLDYSCIRIIDRWKNEQGKYEEMAVWHGRKDPDLLAYDACVLGKMYNEALIVPEVNHSSGIVLVVRLARDLKYTRIFAQEAVDKATRDPVVQDPEASYKKMGWRSGTSQGNAKGVMIATLHRMIRDGSIEIWEPEAWGEMRTFLRDAAGKMGAQRGCHDDRVICLAIGACILTMHPLVQPIEASKERPKFLSRKWVENLIASKRRKREPEKQNYS